MSNFLEELPNNYGKKGRGFTRPAESISKAKRFAMRYASVASLGLAIIGIVI